MNSQKTLLFFLLLVATVLYINSCGMVENVQLLSEPPGAKVYLVPLYKFEVDTTIVRDEAKLSQYIVSEGPTPVMTSAMEKVYIVVFDLNGKKLTSRIDIIEGKMNQAKVVFR